MSFYEMFRDEPFKAVFDEVEEFTSRKLKKYNDYLERTEMSRRNKEIFDAVWGNIEFSSGEIYILDSPLLQRLREIKQLGLACFVYCGSDYSRFYHTLGVVFLADRMAVSLNKCEIDKTESQKEYFRSVVRLAAVFHDAGHMFLSHVSEHYFAKSPLYPRHEKIISGILETFEKRARKGAALHEILGCMMVNTSEVRRLLKCVGNLLEGIKPENEKDYDKLVDYISGLIVGVPVDRDILPYSSIINGPIDADKCDYLSRDSHVTHVPVAVDISRLTQKLSVVETKEINKSELWHVETDDSKPYYELAMSDSAEKALFQLCIARTIMFDSVYYHHKVLTAETELRELINELARLEDPLFTSFLEILEYTDGDFNKYFFRQLKSGRGEADVKIIDRVQKEWENIYARNMAKRIACIMPEYLEGSQSARESLFDEVLTSLHSEEEKKLLEIVQNEYIKICGLMGLEENADENKKIFVIQSPTNVFEHSKIQVPIDMYNGRKREFRGYELVSSRETSSSASYFVTTVENRYLMYLALEKVLYHKYSILLKDECRACGKFSSDEEVKNCKKLLDKGYYDDTPELVRNSLLYNYISMNQVKEIKEKFVAYEGPAGYSVKEKEIEYFFKQIICACSRKGESRTIVKGIYKLLMSSVFVDRKFVAENITAALNDMKLPDDELFIVPLGSIRDSGKHLAYYFNDVKLEGKKIIVKEKLEEALAEDGNTAIIFFDDGSYSGKQFQSIMQEYMGVPKENRETKEHHVNPLEESMREKLKTKSIICTFLMLNSENESISKEKLRELGVEKVNFVYPKDMSKKVLEQDEIFGSKEERLPVVDFLRETGIGILESQKRINGSYKENWDRERVESSALGYNDAQQMVFLKSSVPTYTITAFWQKGQYKNLDWKPLFRRTEK